MKKGLKRIENLSLKYIFFLIFYPLFFLFINVKLIFGINPKLITNLFSELG